MKEIVSLDEERALPHAFGMRHRWRRLSSHPRGDFRIFRVHEVTLERRALGAEGGDAAAALSGSGAPPDVLAYVIDCPDWVNVVPLTADGGVVLVRQYRFGVDRVTYEVPGGVIDADEEPSTAAMRELREETGHRAGALSPLGVVAPNPAIQSNRCHMFVARDCRLVDAVDFDEHEDIDVEVVTRAEALRMVHDGRIEHALAQVALLRALTAPAVEPWVEAP